MGTTNGEAMTRTPPALARPTHPSATNKPKGTGWKSAKRRNVSLRVCVALYGFIAITFLVEAITRQPILASASAHAIAALHGAAPHPNPPAWARGTTILVAPTLPSDQLAFTGGTTIVLSQEAQNDEGVLAHELVHVDQYRRLTSIGAAITYLTHATALLIKSGGNLEHTYFHHPFELEAYRAQFGPEWDQALATRTWP